MVDRFGNDWTRLENLWFEALFKGMSTTFSAFSDAGVYGVFLDCNSSSFYILTHLNTESGLLNTAVRYQRDNARLYPGWTVEQLVEELRWSGGDWSYFDAVRLPAMKELDDETLSLQDLISRLFKEDGKPWRELEEAFMVMCCRVTIRLQRSGVFDRLQRTPDFRVVCIEEDEPLAIGMERLGRIEAEFEGG